MYQSKITAADVTAATVIPHGSVMLGLIVLIGALPLMLIVLFAHALRRDLRRLVGVARIVATAIAEDRTRASLRLF